MIKPTPHGFVVKSETTDKPLSKPDLTKEEAVKRLQQVEYFKHKAGK